jgi:hypothetical protein
VSAVMVNKEIRIEDVQRALSNNIEPAYRVSITSRSTLKVMRNFAVWGTVHVSWSDGKTSFRVRPGGLILAAAYNAIFTTPKIRRALDQAFPHTAQ